MPQSNKNLPRPILKNIAVIFLFGFVPISLRSIIADNVPAVDKRYYDLALLILLYCMLFGFIIYKKMKKQEVDYFYPFLFTSITLLFLVLMLMLK